MCINKSTLGRKNMITFVGAWEVCVRFWKCNFNLVLLIVTFRFSYDNGLRWIPWDLVDDKSTLIEIMAWFCLARNIWLNYEGRRPEFSQNGGYAVGFAERLRAIDLPTTADFIMLACCPVGLTSRCIIHIFIHQSTSRVLCYIFLSSLNDQQYHPKPS